MGRQEDIECLVEDNWPWAQKLAHSWWQFDEAIEAESAAGEAICLIAAKYVEQHEEMPFQFYAFVRLKSFLIDEWRKRHGRKPETRAQRKSFSIYDTVTTSSEKEHAECIEDVRYGPVETHAETMEYLSYFPSETQTILVAVAAGWQQNEIAETWGVTESRISQILARSRERFFLRVKEP